MRWFGRIRWFGAAIVLAMAASIGLPAAPAAATTSLTKEATFTSVQYGWAQVERWYDSSSMFAAEDYLPDGRNDQTGQRKTFFGTGEPASGRFLLYHAPGWDTGTKPIPVLLVHGANDNADRAWAAPNSAANCGASSCPSSGMMQYLSGKGYKVFAINFPHMHGDNYYWAAEIADAISIIKSKTGAAQVDVVAWSKGAFAARQYTSSVVKTGGLAYDGSSIRRLVLLGGPNKGIDYTFRHGIWPSTGVFPECGISANGPAAHTDLMCYGILYSHPEMSIFTTDSGNYFPGQKQMLYKWDSVYSPDTTAQDWYTTYYGGWGFTSYSPGIDEAIAEGSLVATIRQKGIPSSVQTFLYCGGSANIPNLLNENTGPSDGVVFVSSCKSTAGIGNLVSTSVNNSVNHLQLAWDSTVMAKVNTWLSQ